MNIFLLSESPAKTSETRKVESRVAEKELIIKQEELKQSKSMIEKLEQQIRALTLKNESLLEQLHKTEDELESALELFSRENDSSLQKMISASKEKASISMSSSASKLVRKEIIPKVPNNTILMNNRLAQGRELGIKQLKEIVEEVYATKVKFDERCKESNQARETMDQFMYTYLNQKFGLKTIITE